VFLLDGVSIIDTQINSALGNFRITDAVQEFAVANQRGHGGVRARHGGQVSIVTKSGSNQFHGSAFEYLRNSVLDAADFFITRRAVQKPRCTAISMGERSVGLSFEINCSSLGLTKAFAR